MVKAGHIGHDCSFIRLGGIDDICENSRDIKTEEKVTDQKKWKITLENKRQAAQISSN